MMVEHDYGDELYAKAVMVTRGTMRASTAVLQRTFMIGYNRASRLMDRMQAEGVITAPDENGKREVAGAAPAHPGEQEGSAG